MLLRYYNTRVYVHKTRRGFTLSPYLHAPCAQIAFRSFTDAIVGKAAGFGVPFKRL